jgi:hypothetical protein
MKEFTIMPDGTDDATTTQSKRRIRTLLAGLAVILPLSGLAYCFAQSSSSSGATGVAFNWPSIILTLIGALFGVGAAWGILGERVKAQTSRLDTHQGQIEKLFDLFERLPHVFVTKELCLANETASAAPAVAVAAEKTAKAATDAASAAALAVEHAGNLQHADNLAIQELLMKLLTQMGGVK